MGLVKDAASGLIDKGKGLLSGSNHTEEPVHENFNV
jgi:hypothetical protein